MCILYICSNIKLPHNKLFNVEITIRNFTAKVLHSVLLAWKCSTNKNSSRSKWSFSMSWCAFDVIIFDVVKVSSLGPLQANFHLQFTGVGWTKTCETFLKNRIKSENHSILEKLVCNIMWTISFTKTCCSASISFAFRRRKLHFSLLFVCYV